MTSSGSDGESKRIAAGICGILLGAFGVHKFILGYTTEGLIMLLVSLIGGVVTCGAATAVFGIIGLVEGIIYLTKSDAEFTATYVTNKKGWF
jgi:TM2 domain-containing membrane protein YozV